MSAVWFTADLHFGHRKVADLRGFGEDVEAHDRNLIDQWRYVVRPDDQVWVLGDIAVSSPAEALLQISQLPGHKHLVSGNHDNTHPMHRQSHKALPQFLEVFESVQSAARRRINGQEVLLSHFPYSVDRENYEHARYPQWRLPNLGAWLLHGHTHSPEKMGGYGAGEREIHVGVDAWRMSPVLLDDVAALMEEA